MKLYIKPEIEVTDIELEKLIATSLPVEQEEEGVAESNDRRRGDWGDLWNER